jgi:hypothetical protein
VPRNIVNDASLSRAAGHKGRCAKKAPPETAGGALVCEFKISMGLEASAEAAAETAGQKGNEKQHQGDEKHDLGNAHRGAGYAAETEYAGNQRYDQQGDDKAQHFVLRISSGFRRINA